MGEEVSERCRNATLISILLLVPLSATYLPATTSSESPQFNWTIEIGGEVGIKGWEGQTELKLVIENFSIPISGWAFLSIVVPVVVLLLAFAFYLLRQRTQFGSPSGSPNDR